MVNTAGTNGFDNGTKPPDDELREILHGFARARMPMEQRLAALSEQHNYHIKRAKLSKLNKEFDVPTVKKPPPEPLAISLVAEHISQDTNRRHGPDRVQKKIGRKHNIWLPRDAVRKIQHDLDPEGAQARFPGGGRKGKVRGQLTALGIMQEVHCDGHEKLGAIALRLGGVGFGIYGFRDHTGKILHVDAVPNDRCQITVAHCYLDFIEATGEMPVQLTFDGGTETGYMAAAQCEFRRRFLATVSEIERPSTRSIKSTDNIPVESMWKYWLDDEGANIKSALLEAHTNGLFNPSSQLHIDLFQWLWVRIVRHHLDEFKNYFNATPRRSQKEKLLPTAAPDAVFRNPELHNLRRCGTGIPKEDVDEFRARLPLSREHVMRFVADDFDVYAQYVYAEIGSPAFEHSTGWDTYGRMMAYIQNEYT
ncbi:hypothetical protein MKEN_01379000 [Mycena kentingensis (nom. inval.)]|nr:hypothetical protein MKEN_01379000 [Mycena kentingensis (nom. inval.)]